MENVGIKNEHQGTHYDWFIVDPDGNPLAYKEEGKDPYFEPGVSPEKIVDILVPSLLKVLNHVKKAEISGMWVQATLEQALTDVVNSKK